MNRYRQIWAIDFEFNSRGRADRPDPVCMVAHELHSGRMFRLWRDELRQLRAAPFDVGPDSLLVAYYAAAEFSCFQALGWPMPANTLDLFTEFRAKTNTGEKPPSGNGLVGALIYHELPHMEASEKTDMRQLILTRNEWTEQEKQAILEYCESDVLALARLLPVMWPKINLPHALLRGLYMQGEACMVHRGIPIDVPYYDRIVENWERIKLKLIERVDSAYGVYINGSFSEAAFAEYLNREGIPWPLLESGCLELRDEVFRQMKLVYPQLTALYELRVTLAQLRKAPLELGSDGRNRLMLSALGTKTGRNAPSTTGFIFGLPKWMRRLIKPEPGYGLAYCDWSCQEVAIAAALSGDQRMIDGYLSGDPYLAFAKQAGLAPADATKASHATIRDQCKSVVLGILYGMGVRAIAQRINRPVTDACRLLAKHKQTYRRFWDWVDANRTCARFTGETYTVLGWPFWVGPSVTPMTLQNWPMQANGAEMMRVGVILGLKACLGVCAPVHDALLLEAPLDRIEADTEELLCLMGQAGEIVTGGLPVRADAKLVRYPDRYVSEGPEAAMWDLVTGLLPGGA